jgi:hypothetical protein
MSRRQELNHGEEHTGEEDRSGRARRTYHGSIWTAGRELARHGDGGRSLTPPPPVPVGSGRCWSKLSSLPLCVQELSYMAVAIWHWHHRSMRRATAQTSKRARDMGRDSDAR